MAFIEPCFGIGHNLSLICQMTSEDIKHQLIISGGSALCFRQEGDPAVICLQGHCVVVDIRVLVGGGQGSFYSPHKCHRQDRPYGHATYNPTFTQVTVSCANNCVAARAVPAFKVTAQQTTTIESFNCHSVHTQKYIMPPLVSHTTGACVAPRAPKARDVAYVSSYFIIY